MISNDELRAWMPDHCDAAAAVDRLLGRYAEPHRRYHGVNHVRIVVAGCVALFETHSVSLSDADSVSLSDAERHEVVWAALWHDAVYDPRSATNEEDSAALAVKEFALLGVTAPRCMEVARLILLTKGHAVAADDACGAVLVDADLAVLGASPEDYAGYVAGVRSEFAFVADDAWRVGRAKVLRSLLALPRLFHTTAMADREADARRNLGEELASLS